VCQELVECRVHQGRDVLKDVCKDVTGVVATFVSSCVRCGGLMDDRMQGTS